MESQPSCDTYIQHKCETKSFRPFKFKRLPKCLPICKNTFQGDQRNFFSSRKVKNWEKVTSASTILSIVKGYSIDFVETRYQPKTPIRAKLNQVQEELVSEEVKEMLEDGARREANHRKDQFVSHLFLVSKKDGGQRPAINLNDFNRFITYKHFKMEGLHLLKQWNSVTI